MSQQYGSTALASKILHQVDNGVIRAGSHSTPEPRFCALVDRLDNLILHTDRRRVCTGTLWARHAGRHPGRMCWLEMRRQQASARGPEYQARTAGEA